MLQLLKNVAVLLNERSNNMEIRNCTPHVLNIIKQDGEVLDLPPCGIVPL